MNWQVALWGVTAVLAMAGIGYGAYLMTTPDLKLIGLVNFGMWSWCWHSLVRLAFMWHADRKRGW